MKLTEEQKEFLNEVCRGNWKLNSKGEVDVKGSVIMFNLGLTEIPVKFGRVDGWFDCQKNKLTTLKNCPTTIEENMDFRDNNITTLEYFPKTINGEHHCEMANNPLHNYFKNIKEEDFDGWNYIDWHYCFEVYPYLINILMKYLVGNDYKKYVLNKYPQTKIYLK